MKKPSSQRNPARPASVRVISGRWRRRSLPVASLPGLRPTGDRIRETLFNWLMHHVNGARCLDLYAGTGALGIEALSRGASFVHFVEKSREAARILQQNLTKLDAETASFNIENRSALDTLEHWRDAAFDLVFIDPPFADQLWDTSIKLLDCGELLNPGALIYIEKPIDQELLLPSSWVQKKRLNAGKVNCILLEKH